MHRKEIGIRLQEPPQLVHQAQVVKTLEEWASNRQTIQWAVDHTVAILAACRDRIVAMVSLVMEILVECLSSSPAAMARTWDKECLRTWEELHQEWETHTMAAHQALMGSPNSNKISHMVCNQWAMLELWATKWQVAKCMVVKIVDILIIRWVDQVTQCIRRIR